MGSFNIESYRRRNSRKGKAKLAKAEKLFSTLTYNSETHEVNAYLEARDVYLTHVYGKDAISVGVRI